MGQLLTGKPISGSYSHPLCCLTTKVLLTQRPDSESGKGHRAAFRQTWVLILTPAGSVWLLDPGQVCHSLRLT